MWGPVVQWLVQRFRTERLRVRSRRSVTFTPSARPCKVFTCLATGVKFDTFIFIFTIIEDSRRSDRGFIILGKLLSEVQVCLFCVRVILSAIQPYVCSLVELHVLVDSCLNFFFVFAAHA